MPCRSEEGELLHCWVRVTVVLSPCMLLNLTMSPINIQGRLLEGSGALQRSGGAHARPLARRAIEVRVLLRFPTSPNSIFVLKG